MNELDHELSQEDIDKNNLSDVAKVGDTVKIPVDDNTGGGGGVDEDTPKVSTPPVVETINQTAEALPEGFYRCSCGKLLEKDYSICPSCEKQLK